MTRDDLIEFIGAEFAALINAASMVATDTVDNFGPAIDATLRKLEVPEGGLANADVPLGYEQDALDLVAYHSLRRIVRQLAALVDLTVDAPMVRQARSQAFAQAKLLLELAAADVQALGYAVGAGAGAITAGRYNLDFIEPGRV